MALKNPIKEELDKNPGARGLAVIVTNDYEELHPDFSYLPNTYKDGQAMSKVFAHLKFTIYWEHNVSGCRHVQLMDDIVKCDHPRSYSYKCIVVFFSGHGDRSSLLANDGVEVNRTKDVIDKLTCDHRLATIPKLFLFDACRTGEAAGQESTTGKNFLIGYATCDGEVSVEVSTGGVWTQILAQNLGQSHHSVQDILETVKQEMSDSDIEQVPDIFSRLMVGPLHLQEIVELLPQLLESLKEFSSKIQEAVDRTITELNSAKSTEIKNDYRFKEACAHFKQMATEAYAFVDKVDGLFLHGRNKSDLRKLKDAIRQHNFNPLEDFVDKLQRFLVQAEQLHQQFCEACRMAEQSCIRIEEHCKYKSKEAQKKKNRTRTVGGVMVGGTMAAGIFGGLVASVAAGSVTVGAVGSVAAGGVVGTTTAVGTYVVAKKFADLEKAFQGLRHDYYSLRLLASDMDLNTSKVYNTLGETAEYADAVKTHPMHPDSVEAICYALDMLCHRCDEYYGITSLCREEVKQKKEELTEATQ